MRPSVLVLAVLVASPLHGAIVQWRVEHGGNGNWYEAVLAD